MMRSPAVSRTWGFLDEIRKLSAFFRRDLLVAWSYRLAFVVDWINLFGQVLVFALVGRLIDPSALPIVDGSQISYVEFVVTGIAVTTFLQIALGRVINSIREEQLMGTLEALLMTPTSPATLQVGSMMYDLAYIPVRTILFLVLASAIFGADLNVGGFGPVVAILLVFIPFAWGIGMLGAAAVLTYRRGVNILTFGISLLMIGSNAYVPISVFPEWAQRAAAVNPVSIALYGSRQALLGDGGWDAAWHAIRLLFPIAVAALGVGIMGVRFALKRERRRGTLGLY